MKMKNICSNKSFQILIITRLYVRFIIIFNNNIILNSKVIKQNFMHLFVRFLVYSGKAIMNDQWFDIFIRNLQLDGHLC